MYEQLLAKAIDMLVVAMWGGEHHSIVSAFQDVNEFLYEKTYAKPQLFDNEVTWGEAGKYGYTTSLQSAILDIYLRRPKTWLGESHEMVRNHASNWSMWGHIDLIPFSFEYNGERKRVRVFMNGTMILERFI